MDIKDCWYKGVCNQYPTGCNRGCLRFIEMESLLEQSNLPEYRWFPIPLNAGIDIEQFRELSYIKDNIREWVEEGNNMYLFSPSFGNGKTSWAIKLMLAYFNQIWAGNAFRRRGIFISVPEFLDRNREVIGDRDEEYLQLRNDLLNCDLVVWDDIAATKLTDYNHSMLLNYIDARVVNKKSNIFTGNLDYTKLQSHLGGRLASRVWNTSEVIQFRDQDKRGRRND